MFDIPAQYGKDWKMSPKCETMDYFFQVCISGPWHTTSYISKIFYEISYFNVMHKNITQFPAGQCLGGCQMITLTVFTLILFKSCTWFKLGLNWGEKRTLLKTVFMA